MVKYCQEEKMKDKKAGGDGAHQLQIAFKSLIGIDWYNKLILDIGSSNGFVSSQILKKTGAKKIVGIEIDELRIKKAKEFKKQLNENRLEFYQEDATDLSRFSDEKFDGVFSNMVFQQLKNSVKKTLNEIYRVMKTGSVAVINFNQEKSEVVVEIQKLLLKKEIKKTKEITKELVIGLAKKIGFHIIKSKSELDIYYHKNIDDLIGDPKKASITVKNQNYSDYELKIYWRKLKEVFESKKTPDGYPEKWSIVYLQLKKISEEK